MDREREGKREIKEPRSCVYTYVKQIIIRSDSEKERYIEIERDRRNIWIKKEKERGRERNKRTKVLCLYLCQTNYHSLRLLDRGIDILIEREIDG